MPRRTKTKAIAEFVRIGLAKTQALATEATQRRSAPDTGVELRYAGGNLRSPPRPISDSFVMPRPHKKVWKAKAPLNPREAGRDEAHTGLARIRRDPMVSLSTLSRASRCPTDPGMTVPR